MNSGNKAELKKILIAKLLVWSFCKQKVQPKNQNKSSMNTKRQPNFTLPPWIHISYLYFFHPFFLGERGGGGEQTSVQMEYFVAGKIIEPILSDHTIN